MLSTTRRYPALRSRLRLQVSPNSTRRIRFSRTARAYEKDTSSHEDARKPTGSYTGVLSIFALSAAIGWGVHAFNDTRKSSPNDSLKRADPADFVKYTLAKRENISSTLSMFTLKPAQGLAIDAEQLYDPRAITSVQFKQPQLQIARSYTVLPRIAGQPPEDPRFLIRKEEKGEVSGYLHRLAIGSQIELRGPSVEYVLPEGVTDVVFLAGGTGIAPALQVAEEVGKDGIMHILWANRKREDCRGGKSDARSASASLSWGALPWVSRPMTPMTSLDGMEACTQNVHHDIVNQLESMKSRESTEFDSKKTLLVEYYVDEWGSFIRSADVAKLLETAPRKEGARLILVSGPEGFVSHWAGPKEWSGGREVQGPLGGALATLDLHGWQVVKL
ncbi:hypothetical protein LTR02_015723 [Friedmanniomyces endolithicus]|nr:hypothetical protein LTR94_009916 [Friedmanniomyces endolithicus]KAK0783419.1 hypothetical protein LTR75_014118 [Friedmanniomyces endolithicus]KAK0785543.1 hypothetical protein LTR59_010981 [Friedmanniomyces endolithicus]KAK0803084.1 hypothetical protein LTR38_006270 [Friedmanniomyces endolithicus]KAK0858992.1 hypothetical protein LTS02_009527 [Friedmanniomyces endolithicus]